jgi:hypothetical protein
MYGLWEPSAVVQSDYSQVENQKEGNTQNESEQSSVHDITRNVKLSMLM